MTAHLDGPRAGSRAFMALKKLHDLGGHAFVNQWMTAAGWTTTVHSFHADVISKLVVRGKVFPRDGGFAISDDGLEHIGIAPDAPRQPPPVFVTARYVAPKRPLDNRNKVRPQLMREGSFDYLAIPSLMGSSRVEHKTSLNVAIGDVQG